MQQSRHDTREQRHVRAITTTNTQLQTLDNNDKLSTNTGQQRQTRNYKHWTTTTHTLPRAFGCFLERWLFLVGCERHVPDACLLGFVISVAVCHSDRDRSDVQTASVCPIPVERHQHQVEEVLVQAVCIEKINDLALHQDHVLQITD